MSNDELENCPFCYGDDLSTHDVIMDVTSPYGLKTWFVMCNDCQSRGPSATRQELAASEWCTRDGMPRELDLNNG